MTINLYPLSYPDEIHASQISRYHRSSGNSSSRYSYSELFDCAPFRSTHWIPQHLERFAAKLPGSAIGNLEVLLRQNTLYPLFETFRNAHLNLTDDAMPIAEQISNMPKRIVGESGEIHLCKDCLVSDCDEYGQPYIHRNHQIPGVQVCWRHGCHLISCCPNCGCPFERINEFILAPWEPCEGCGFNLADATFYAPKQDASDQELSYAGFARDMLLSSTKPIGAEKLAAIYKSRLTELGYSRKSQIDHQAIMAALEQHFGKSVLAQIDVAYRNKKNQHWFRFGGASTILDVPLPRHLALTHFLFGSASKFWEFAAEISSAVQTASCVSEMFSASAPEAMLEEEMLHPETESTSNEFKSEKKSSRLRIEAILRQNVDWTESELWKAHPGLMKNLLRNHDDGFVWLKNLIETIKVQNNEKLVPQSVSQHPEDLKWAQSFGNTAIALYSSADMPKKISRNYLMREAGWGKGSMPSYDKFPLARQQLELLCESDWHFYARRMLWTKLRVGAAGTSERGVLGASGIEHHQGRLVLEHFSSVSANRILRVGTIMDILNEYKIPKDWEGPASNQVFHKPGRNSSRGGQVNFSDAN